MDIGRTGQWGRPIDRNRQHLWPNYALCPYAQDFRPDVILIDGRFRVACALVAALQTSAPNLWIHDYPDRPYYHVLERFLKVEERAESLVRLGRLKDFDVEAARRMLGEYLYDYA